MRRRREYEPIEEYDPRKRYRAEEKAYILDHPVNVLLPVQLVVVK